MKQYADALENPPLLVTSDIKRIEIHTNFTNTVKKVYSLTLSDLADARKREILRWVFADPEKLRPGVTRAMVTVQAAERFSELAHRLQAKGYEPQRVAHFLNRLIFSMFAEDVGLLPNNVFKKMLVAAASHPESFESYAKQLFSSMAKGGTAAFEVIDWFNGGLFDDDSTLPLDKAEIDLLLRSAELDWTWIEPSIFGTLFERGLDPDKRSQQGTHYTDPDTIMKIVQPVVLDPWERAWAEEKKYLAAQIEKAKRVVSEAAKKRYQAFLEQLYQYRVLDPACGSGNFLYLTLRGLKNFEKKVIHEAEALGLPRYFPHVGPEAVLGIEVNSYAVELALVTVWIGEIQGMMENGFGVAKNPILKPLQQIECRDALLNDDGSEAAWPSADAIVGNPPFLGTKKQFSGLGREYPETLRRAFAGRVPGFADLVCYWFDKARQQVVDGKTQRAGLVATNSIRGGANRAVLDAIGRDARIMEAWSDEDWINEGAAVRVSLIAFEQKHGTSPLRLNGGPAVKINPDLTSGANLSVVRPIPANRAVGFVATVKSGPFDIPGDTARTWLTLPNPNGRPNSDVIRPWANGMDMTRGASDGWIIDFGVDMSEVEAAGYEQPIEYVREHVKPLRDKNNRASYRDNWWLLAEPIPKMRKALAGLRRFIATPVLAKHRLFVWMHGSVLADHQLVVVARDDDAFLGLLHSVFHEKWSLRCGTSLEDRPRYTPSTTFETFPFPDSLGPDRSRSEFTDDMRAQRIAAATRHLLTYREAWLNPPDLIDRVPEVVPGFPDRLVPKNAEAAAELKKRTLTSLYNARPAWLQHAHRELDEAVAAAYGWEWPLEDEEILKRLLELNLQRSAVKNEPR